MTYEKELIEKYKTELGYKQDKQVICDLGISKSHFSEIKKGHRHFTDEQVVTLCKKAKFNASEELAQVHIGKAKSKDVKQAWSEIVKKIKASAAAILLGLMLVGANEKSLEPAFL